MVKSRKHNKGSGAFLSTTHEPTHRHYKIIKTTVSKNTNLGPLLKYPNPTQQEPTRLIKIFNYQQLVNRLLPQIGGWIWPPSPKHFLCNLQSLVLMNDKPSFNQREVSKFK